MPNFEQMYFTLFSAICNAVDAIGEMNFGEAKEILLEATKQTEEQYIDSDEPE